MADNTPQWNTLDPSVYAELDNLLGPVDAELLRAYPGPATGRQPVHTVYLPADRMHPGVVAQWGAAALAVLDEFPPPPYDPELHERVVRKLGREPIEDLRIDFEDGYGVPADRVEDEAARSAAKALRAAGPLPFSGLRIKSLEGPSRHRAVRTLDIFLEALDGPPPDGFVVTLPKVSAPAQVEAMVLLCQRLETAHGLPVRALRFEVQVETPPAVLGPDGTATIARMIGAADGRCTALHYGTYDYSAALGVAAAQQSMAHPVADFAKAVMQVVAAGTGVRLSDGSTNVLPVGSGADVRAAWQLHAGLVRRSLEQGLYQGWDMHPAQLPTRFGATYGFFREGRVVAARRLRAYLERRSTGVLDEPATARALAGFLLRGLDCGAFDADEAGFDRAELTTL
jgi:citrate lyase beta subunit